MPFFQQETFLAANARGPLTDPAYVEAHVRYKRLVDPEGIDAALAKDHLDVLIAPTGGPAWSEGKLISYAYEQATHAARPPEFRESVP